MPGFQFGMGYNIEAIDENSEFGFMTHSTQA